MPFITDRDLLIQEPDLFRDAGFLAQKLITATGSITSGKLTITGSDFAAVNVTVGHVVVHGSTPLEITLRNSATQVTVSMLRASIDDAVIPPPNASTAAVSVFTFAPQISAAHATVLSMLGLAAAGKGIAGEADETAVTNPRDLATLESAIALSLIWAAAASVAGPASNAASRADYFRMHAGRERAIAAARLDLDGDGIPDAERRPGAASFLRQ
jgi:hypothetical protein